MLFHIISADHQLPALLANYVFGAKSHISKGEAGSLKAKKCTLVTASQNVFILVIQGHYLKKWLSLHKKHCFVCSAFRVLYSSNKPSLGIAQVHITLQTGFSLYTRISVCFSFPQEMCFYCTENTLHLVFPPQILGKVSIWIVLQWIHAAHRTVNFPSSLWMALVLVSPRWYWLLAPNFQERENL